jgi:hypothetical protein
MAESRTVQTCNHAYPSTLLPWPYWVEALGCEWSCTRVGAPDAIDDVRRCENCPNWEARIPPLSELASAIRSQKATTRGQGAVDERGQGCIWNQV